jgi:hypothetical protein
MALGTLIAMWPTAAVEIVRRKEAAPPRLEVSPDREMVEVGA